MSTCACAARAACVLEIVGRRQRASTFSVREARGREWDCSRMRERMTLVDGSLDVTQRAGARHDDHRHRAADHLSRAQRE